MVGRGPFWIIWHRGSRVVLLVIFLEVESQREHNLYMLPGMVVVWSVPSTSRSEGITPLLLVLPLLGLVNCFIGRWERLAAVRGLGSCSSLSARIILLAISFLMSWSCRILSLIQSDQSLVTLGFVHPSSISSICLQMSWRVVPFVGCVGSSLNVALRP